MDSKENHQKDHRRTYRPSLVPQSKNNRWDTISQARKIDCEAKIEIDSSSAGHKFKGKELLKGEKVLKKPPFVVPGIVRSNDNFFKSQSLPKNSIKKPMIERRPLHLPKPQQIVSSFTDVRKKPITSYKQTVLPKISVDQSTQTPTKTPSKTLFAASTGKSFYIHILLCKLIDVVPKLLLYYLRFEDCRTCWHIKEIS